MIKLFAPNDEYTGVVANVAFANGVGEIDEENETRIEYFRRKGYGVGQRFEKAGDEGSAGEAGKNKALTEMTREELDAKATEQGIVGASSMANKDEVITAIEDD